MTRNQTDAQGNTQVRPGCKIAPGVDPRAVTDCRHEHPHVHWPAREKENAA